MKILSSPLLGFAVVTLLISGCISNNTVTSEGISTEVRSRTFNQEFNRTFNAVLRTLKMEGFRIDNADNKNGLIYTAYQNQSSLNTSLENVQQIKVDAQLKKRVDGTNVTLTVSIQQRVRLIGPRSEYVDARQARQYYSELFDKIAEKIGER